MTTRTRKSYNLNEKFDGSRNKDNKVFVTTNIKHDIGKQLNRDYILILLLANWQY